MKFHGKYLCKSLQNCLFCVKAQTVGKTENKPIQTQKPKLNAEKPWLNITREETPYMVMSMGYQLQAVTDCINIF